MGIEELIGIDREIEKIFYELVGIRSDTNTIYEKSIEAYFVDFFSELDYYKANSNYYGTYPIPEDSYTRAVSWGLVKGRGAATVILLNHNDVVDIEDFKVLKPYAYSPRELEKELCNIRQELPKEAREDLESGGYIFGRGTADMKAGIAIQLALMKRYSQLSSFHGNILFLSVPDEENLSAGMRSATALLEILKERHGLDYIMIINSEPHQRTQKSVGVISEGSVGKIMPFVYVRGYLSHAGKVFEGFNPISLLSDIVNRTELNLSLSDFIEGEASPPPTWLCFKDSKSHYDVSMPLSAWGYMSVHTLTKNPVLVMDSIKDICVKAFTVLIDTMNEKFRIFRERLSKGIEPLPWEVKVVTYRELYEEAETNNKDRFRRDYKTALEEAAEKLKHGQKSLADINFEMIDFIFNYISDMSPRVVIGLAPPYYPSVSNINIKGLDKKYSELAEDIIKFAQEHFQQHYMREFFYTGISDLSYTYMENSNIVIKSLSENMPLFGSLYSIPLDKIEKLSMPCLNIGPWGKDFHKLTERVYKEDLFYRTPLILDYAISKLFG